MENLELADAGEFQAVPTKARSKKIFTYHKKNPKKMSKVKKRLLITLGVLAGAVLVFFGIKLLMAAHRIITRNSGEGAPALFGKLDPSQLKREGDGRINILLLGIGGAGHEGPNLSDTIIVASIDPRTKDVAMLSLPRDMYVPIPGRGYAKINAVHAYGEDKKDGGPPLAKSTVSKVLDVPIHYFFRIDFDGFKKAVDAVGGIDVDNPTPIYDPTYPNGRGGVSTFQLPAGRHHMNGELALKYVRCRSGTCGNDFGRAQRQQQVLVALKQKALEIGTISNPAKISQLIDAFGNHIKTDLQLSEIKKLALIAKDIDSSRIVQKVLDNILPDGLLVDSNIGGGYVLLPKGGNFNLIRAFVHKLFADNFILEENASLDVQNGTNKTALTKELADLLVSYNYNVIKTGPADKTNYQTTLLYDYTDGKKPYTINYLERRFNVKAKRMQRNEKDPDIRIIVGSDYRLPSVN